jgi:ATP-binding cassette, subfamily B, bacterial MsbA
VDSLARLFPFVWQQRRRLLTSAVLAGIVALLWAGALLLVFPVVKLMLQGQSLHQYVDTEVRSTRQAMVAQFARSAELGAKLRRLRDHAGSDATAVATENDRARCLDELSSAARREMLYVWIAARVVSRVPADQFAMLAYLMLACLVLTGLKCWVGYIQETMVGSIVQRTMQSLRERLFRSTLQLDQQTLALETTPQLPVLPLTCSRCRSASPCLAARPCWSRSRPSYV